MGKDPIRVKIKMHQYVKLRGLIQQNIGPVDVAKRTINFNHPCCGYKVIVVPIAVTMFI